MLSRTESSNLGSIPLSTLRARFEQLLGQHALLAMRQARSEVAMAPDLRKVVDGSLAANVLGFVGLDGNGLAGIEQVYNQKILGEPGKVFIEKDSRGRAYESTEVPGRVGQTVVLTIDQSIQYHAEAALTTAIDGARFSGLFAMFGVVAFVPLLAATAKPKAEGCGSSSA